MKSMPRRRSELSQPSMMCLRLSPFLFGLLPILPNTLVATTISSRDALDCYRMSLVKHSTDRILTTHAGRLDGPRDLREMTFSFMSGRGPDIDTVMARVQSGITETIRKQADAGIDIISD